MKRLAVVFVVFVALLTGCGADNTQSSTMSGEINIAGSSTVYPIASEVSYQYTELNPDVTINLQSTGTGGGFELFDNGEIDINNASRAINDDEKQIASDNGIDYTELYLGIDGITVIVNPENDWITDATVEELKMIFDADYMVTNWSDINPSWPDEKINLYGPTSASGTYDFFCEEIVQEEGEDHCSIRSDMSGTENDNEVVTNVANDVNSIGFLGYAYYTQNIDSVNAVAVNGVLPTVDTIRSGDYYLSRPLYIYVNNNKMSENPALADFIHFYMQDIASAVEVSGYVALTQEEYDIERAKIA